MEIFIGKKIGTATGIKPAGTYADLVMGYLEIKLFSKLKSHKGTKIAHCFWQHYRRYLDDGQIMWDSRLGNFNDVFNLMNELHPMLKFTSERSFEKLIYLDIILYKTDNCIKTEIYHKETDVDTVLPYDSCHPRHILRNIPFNAARRIKSLTDDPEKVESNFDKLRIKFMKAKYPIGIIETAIDSARKLTTYELRCTKNKDENNNVLAFVHTYDPSLPQLAPLVRECISRIYKNREVKHIFKDIRFINSQREPLSLRGILHHSKFDESSQARDGSIIQKCNFRGCRSCEDILEIDSFYFRNSGITYNIKHLMTCTTRNLIYATICKNCGYTYVGETINLRSRMSAHRSNSKTLDAAQQACSKHLHECGKGFHILPLFKLREENKIARLVKEDYFIKFLKPDLNKDTRNLLKLNSNSVR